MLLNPSLKRPSKLDFTNLTSHHHRSRQSDVILRTSDKVDFYSLAVVLQESSRLFADRIVALRRASGFKGADQPRLLIVVEEDAQTVQEMLEWIYRIAIGVPPPRLSSIEHVSRLTALFHKYGCDSPILVLKQRLVDYMYDWPYDVYALACRYRYDEETALASKFTHRLPFYHGLNRTPVDPIDPHDWHSLQDIQLVRKGGVKHELEYWAGVEAVRCSSCAGLDGVSVQGKWWNIFLERAANELERSPIPDVICSKRFVRRCVRRARCSGCTRAATEFQRVGFMSTFADDLERWGSHV